VVASVRLPANADPGLAARLRAVRYVYTDLDGTLLGPGGSIFTSPGGGLTLDPAATLVAGLGAGLEVVPISGRNKWQLLGDVRLLGLDDYIAEAGCLIVRDRMKEEIPVAGGFGPGEGSVFDRILSSGALELLAREFPGRIEPHDPWNEDRDFSHVLRGNVNLARANSALTTLDLPISLIDNGIIHPRSHTLAGVDEIHAYHLLPAGAGKAGALALDLSLRRATPAEAIAVGDSASDLELASHVEAFFLVANGARDESLAARAARLDNVYVTAGEMGLGWAEAVRSVLHARTARD